MMESKGSRSALVLATIAGLVSVGWFAVFEANGSLVAAPAPLTLVYPMAQIQQWLDKLAVDASEAVIVPVVAVGCAALLLAHLVNGARRIPTVSIFVFIGLVIANILFWVWAWHFGIQYQGAVYTVSIALRSRNEIT